MWCTASALGHGLMWLEDHFQQSAVVPHAATEHINPPLHGGEPLPASRLPGADETDPFTSSHRTPEGGWIAGSARRIADHARDMITGLRLRGWTIGTRASSPRSPRTSRSWSSTVRTCRSQEELARVRGGPSSATAASGSLRPGLGAELNEDVARAYAKPGEGILHAMMPARGASFSALISAFTTAIPWSTCWSRLGVAVATPVPVARHQPTLRPLSFGVRNGWISLDAPG